MKVSIFHIGLPLDHRSIPAEERPRIAKSLSDLQARMRAAGYNYEIFHASPEIGLEDFKYQLRTQPCDGVLIGGGLASNPVPAARGLETVAIWPRVLLKASVKTRPQTQVRLRPTEVPR